jgi:carboxylate-amine ligase
MEQRAAVQARAILPTIGKHRERGFRFGLETEYLLVDAATYRPLGFRELTFEELDAALESIPIDDLPGMGDLQPMPPHRKKMPFYVEGYHVPDAFTEGARVIPKGIEIRTPPCDSIAETLELVATLYERLQGAMRGRGYRTVALSHHPVEEDFSGPQGKRAHDRWQWCMQAMLTYGPDLNISLPPDLTAQLDATDLFAKVNYYAPALSAMSLASPIYRGKPWVINGRQGRSVRTYRRSLSGQALRMHLEQGGRLEFKSFEMTPQLADFHAYLLLWLTLLLDNGLAGRATNQSRVYDLGAVACDGLHVRHVRERAAEVLDSAQRILPAWGFDPAPLEPFARRVATRRVPADEILALYNRERSLPAVLKHLEALRPEAPVAAPKVAVGPLCPVGVSSPLPALAY